MATNLDLPFCASVQDAESTKDGASFTSRADNGSKMRADLLFCGVEFGLGLAQTGLKVRGYGQALLQKGPADDQYHGSFDDDSVVSYSSWDAELVTVQGRQYLTWCGKGRRIGLENPRNGGLKR